MTAARYARIRACLDRRQPDLTVVTDNVHKPHNVSAIMRTCDAVGVFSLHAVMTDDKAFRARSGIAMGSEKWLQTTLHDTTESALQAVRDAGLQVVAVHQSERSVDFREIDYCAATAVLFGAEKFGVSSAGARAADRHVFIPMMGMVESYNVSVAAAIVLLEAQRQRSLARMYDSCRLDPQVYRRQLFSWYRPTEADWCDRYGVPYPALDDTGELVDAAGFAELRSEIERKKNEN